jgi:hypothetical protein
LERNPLLAYAHAGDVLSDSRRAATAADLQRAHAFYGKAVHIAEEMVAADPQDNNAQIDLMATQHYQGTVDHEPKNARESLAILRRAAALADKLQQRDPSNVFVTKTRSAIAQEIALREAQLAR